ncbi:MAG: HD domain-containing protein [Candidatus Diapherotrites archaeon]|nr:HD domain-containing protein [Candidatus Diapherotrites archaeon]
MEKQFISELKTNDTVNSYFAVKYKRPVKPYKKGNMFKVGLSDKTGEIDLTYWGGTNQDKVKQLWSSFDIDDVVLVNGVVSEYQGESKIDVNEGVGKISKTSEYNIADLVAVSERDLDEMASELMSKVEEVKDPYLSKLLRAFFEDAKFMEKFKKAPAAMYMHHAYVGGLLEHTLHVLSLCEAIYKIYPKMDHDLLVTGAILHDIGKTREFMVGTSIKVTEEGMLRGHLVIGEEMVIEKMKGILGFPETLMMKVAHIILSHHGNGEFGSPKNPQFPEAAAVHYADEMDSKIDQYVSIKEDTDSTDFRIYTKRLGELYLK